MHDFALLHTQTHTQIKAHCRAMHKFISTHCQECTQMLKCSLAESVSSHSVPMGTAEEEFCFSCESLSSLPVIIFSSTTRPSLMHPLFSLTPQPSQCALIKSYYFTQLFSGLAVLLSLILIHRHPNTAFFFPLLPLSYSHKHTQTQ